jgi:hypothetical protein
MSVYSKLVIRLSILSVLTFGLVALTSTPAGAFDCRLDCAHQLTACQATCHGFPIPPDEGCTEACQVDYLDCLSNC